MTLRRWSQLSFNYFGCPMRIPLLAAVLAVLLWSGIAPHDRFAWVFCICLAISATYELIEWGTAVSTGTAADAFLGTQGDPWDTQEDMAMAAVGAIVALITLPRLHDRQLARMKG